MHNVTLAHRYIYNFPWCTVAVVAFATMNRNATTNNIIPAQQFKKPILIEV